LDPKWRKCKAEGGNYIIEELHNLYSSSNIVRMVISRRMRWAGHVEHRRKKSTAYKVLAKKPEEMRPLGRQSWRSE
jgi:hypothetical protein